MKKIYILLGLALLGFLPVIGIDLRTGKELITQWVCIALIASYFIKNFWLRAGIYWLLIRTVISAIQAGYHVAYAALVTILLYVLFYEILVAKADKNKLLNTICIITFIQAAWMLLQYVGIWPFFYPTGYPEPMTIWHKVITITKPFYPTITGLTCNFNMAASFLALGLPAFFRKGWHWCIPLIVFALFVTDSLGGIIPGMIVLGVYLLPKLWKIKINLYAAILGIFLVCAAIAYTPSEVTNKWENRINSFYNNFKGQVFHDHRYQINASVIKHIIPKRPIIGWGLDQFKILYPAIQKEFFPEVTQGLYKHLHNEYLQAWVEGGVIFIIIILGFLISLLYKLIYLIKQSDITTLLALGLFVGFLNAGVNFLFHTPYCLIWIAYAAIVQKEYNYSWGRDGNSN